MTCQDLPDEPGLRLVRISGELDLNGLQELDRELAAVLEGQPRHLVVDLSGLSFADSSAITLWLRWAAAVEHFELRDPPPLVRMVLSRMGLSERLGIEA